MKNTKGFAVVEALLIVVIIGALAGVGYYVYSQQNKDKNTNETTFGTTQQAPEPEQEESAIPEGYTQYTNQELGISFYYPEEWGEVIKDSFNQFGGTTYPIYNFSKFENSEFILGGFSKNYVPKARGGSLIDYGGFTELTEGKFQLITSGGETTDGFAADNYAYTESKDCIYSLQVNYYGDDALHGICNLKDKDVLGFNFAVQNASSVDTEQFKAVVDSVKIQ